VIPCEHEQPTTFKQPAPMSPVLLMLVFGVWQSSAARCHRQGEQLGDCHHLWCGHHLRVTIIRRPNLDSGSYDNI